MIRFLFFLLLFTMACSTKREFLDEVKLKEFDGYYIYFRKETIFINKYENLNNKCSPIIVYYTNNSVDSISNKLNDFKTCKYDSLKIKLLSEKFLLLYSKYKVTNISYCSNENMSYGYWNPYYPEYVKFLNEDYKSKKLNLDKYKPIENNWYELK